MLVSVVIYLALWDKSLPCRCTSKQFRHMATPVANKLEDTIIDTSLLRTCEDTEILLILLAFIRPLSLPLAWLLLVRVCRLFGSGSFSYRQKLTVSGCKHLQYIELLPVFLLINQIEKAYKNPWCRVRSLFKQHFPIIKSNIDTCLL